MTTADGIPRGALVAAALAAALAGCGPREDILPGERFGVRETDAAQAAQAAREDPEIPTPPQPQPGQPPTRVALRPYVVEGEPAPLALPPAQTNAAWTHAGGNPAHRIPHPALDRSLVAVWQADIGAGNRRRLRLTAAPVVAGGRIFTMDAESVVQATDTQGRVLWRQTLTPPSERAGEASGGGLAVADGALFVTTGYGNLHRLEPATGREVWRQALEALPSAAPTVAGGLVYLTTRDSRAWAIDADTGRVLWQIEGATAGAVLSNGASPAIAGRAVIFPFGSGEVIAVLRQGGLRLWTTSVTGQRVGRAYAEVGDITADPVIVGETAYVGTPTGRLVAFDTVTGDRRWTAQQGAFGPVKVEGGSVFFLSDTNELVRVDAEDGSEIWSATLPLYATERVRRRKRVFAHYGPLLAGGRLIVVSSDGLLREIDPTSGQIIGQRDLGADAAAPPVIAGSTLYVLTGDGRLTAFR